jgi:hypothetical protein
VRTVCRYCQPTPPSKAVEPHCHQGRPGESRGPGTVMLAVGRVHMLYMRGQLTRIPGTVPSGFGRSVRAPRICPVNPRRHPKAVEPHCHQRSPGESRGPGPVMLAVGRVHTLYMRGQLSATALAAVVGCKRRVRARIIWVRQPQRQSEADPAVVTRRWLRPTPRS